MTEAPHPIQSLTTDYLSDLARRGEEHLVYQNASGILTSFGKTTLFDHRNKDDTSIFLKITPTVSITPDIQLRLREGDKQVDDARYVGGVCVSLQKTLTKDREVFILEALIAGTNSWATFVKFKEASVNDWTGQRATPERLAQIKSTVEQLGLALFELQKQEDAAYDFEDGHHA